MTSRRQARQVENLAALGGQGNAKLAHDRRKLGQLGPQAADLVPTAGNVVMLPSRPPKLD